MAPLQCFRMNPTGEAPDRMLTEEGQWTAPWGDSEDGSRCSKCDGAKQVEHECWSCLLTGEQRDCPVCQGKVRWRDTCPVCRGSGQTDGAPRHGVSVFPTLEGLYHYMQSKEAGLDDCLVVSLEARTADDVDFDADQGALLVIPLTIRACEPANKELAEAVKKRSAELSSS